MDGDVPYKNIWITNVQLVYVGLTQARPNNDSTKLYNVMSEHSTNV